MRKSEKLLIVGIGISISSLLWVDYNLPLLLIQFIAGATIMLLSLNYISKNK